jgi:hypothetical protein
MKKIFLWLWLLAGIGSMAVAQSPYAMQGDRVILGTSGTGSGSRFYIYTPTYAAKAIYKTEQEATNEYPELLMSSILCADTQSWYNANILPSSGLRKEMDASYFSKVKNMNREETYYDLACKFEFNNQGEEMAIVKFYIHISKSQSFSGVYVMQKEGNRWYRTATPFTTELALLIMSFDQNKLQQVFRGKPTGVKRTDDLISKVKLSDGSISIDKLLAVYKKWQQEQDKTSLDYFKDPKAW